MFTFRYIQKKNSLKSNYSYSRDRSEQIDSNIFKKMYSNQKITVFVCDLIIQTKMKACPFPFHSFIFLLFRQNLNKVHWRWEFVSCIHCLSIETAVWPWPYSVRNDSISICFQMKFNGRLPSAADFEINFKIVDEPNICKIPHKGSYTLTHQRIHVNWDALWCRLKHTNPYSHKSLKRDDVYQYTKGRSHFLSHFIFLACSVSPWICTLDCIPCKKVLRQQIVINNILSHCSSNDKTLWMVKCSRCFRASQS